MRVVLAASALAAILLLSACDNAPGEPPTLRYSESNAAISDVAVYRFDILPQHNPSKLVKAYQPLIDYLNAHLGSKVRLQIGIPLDFRTFEADIRARRPDFLMGNPWHTVKAIDQGYHVIAMAGDAADFRGIFVVRKDSPVRTPADLKGSVVTYPSPTALAAGMMAQWYLHRHGVNVNRDTRNVYVGSQESSIMNAYLGHSAAGATWPPPWRQFQIDYPKEAAEMKVIWQTEPMLNNGILARNDVPDGVREQVRQLLQTLDQSEEGKMILDGMQTARFHPADDRQYQVVRQFVTRFEREIRPVEGS